MLQLWWINSRRTIVVTREQHRVDAIQTAELCPILNHVSEDNTVGRTQVRSEHVAGGEDAKHDRIGLLQVKKSLRGVEILHAITQDPDKGILRSELEDYRRQY